MFKLDQKGIAHLLIPIILLLGLIVGVYLVGKETNIFPKAFSPRSLSDPIESPTPAPFTCSACAADIVKDSRNQVNAQDYAVLSSCFNKSTSTTLSGGRSCAPADINKDGKINQADADCLKSVYSQKCSQLWSAVNLTPPSGSATPNGKGDITVSLTRNDSDYITVVISGILKGLMPNTHYEVWLCSKEGTGCGTQSGNYYPTIVTDKQGNTPFFADLTITKTNPPNPNMLIKVVDTGRCNLPQACLIGNYKIPVPTPAKKVFMTSTTYDGNLGGIVGADGKCQARADAAGLGGTWKAWLSAGTSMPSNRFIKSNIYYKNVDGNIIANNWNDLTDQTLNSSLVEDEKGVLQSISDPWNVWTNTWSSGSIYDTASNLTCNNWTSNSSSLTGRGGASWKIDYRWTASELVGQRCNTLKHLYCFEQ